MKIPRLANRRTSAGFAAVVVAGAAALVVAAAPNASADETDLYVVQFAADPVASYDGGVAGIPATKPGRGQKVKPNSPNAQAYRQHLENSHRDARRDASVDENQVVRELTVAFNGFTAALTKAEVGALEASKDVVKVWPNEILEINTAHTPDFLGLTGSDGVWQERFGGQDKAGEGVIVGVLDTGFTPQNPSFAPLPEPRPDQAIIDAKWAGECVAGTEEPVTCNNKASTVNHNGPWVTTVAAGTHSPKYTTVATLGDGSTFSGVGIGTAVPSAPLIDSTAAGLPGAPAVALRQCSSDADNNPTNGVVPVLDPAKVAGKIVICERGGNARVDKSLAIRDAGGVGMIQYNTSLAESFSADVHWVPSVHVSPADGAAIKACAAGTSNPTAALSEYEPLPAQAPVLAGFSSPGPAVAGGGDLLKPDIMAPGVDVVAAFSPATRGLDFDVISGTSMAAPHITGLAALIISANPTWSPMWVKSALMTTATPNDNTGGPIQRVGNATPFDYGSGQVVPAPAFNPGLVYDSDIDDWFQYACSINQLQLIGGAGVCASLPPIDPSDFNGPSIATGALVGTQTITRTVTNTDPEDGPAGPR